MISELKKELKKLGNKKKAQDMARFFKTGQGEYGEGDVFLGISVPTQRKVAKKYRDLSINNLQALLKSPIHEHRMVALFVMLGKFKESPKEIVSLYLNNAKQVNNWDLVDCSAHYILGEWLLKRDRKVLYKLAKSKNLWERRISVISTFAFIRKNDFEDCLKIAELLLHDDHDLIHKAVGWMLREVGNRDLATEEKFLKKHHKYMPRTMLRYSIEKFPEKKRKAYMAK